MQDVLKMRWRIHEINSLLYGKEVLPYQKEVALKREKYDLLDREAELSGKHYVLGTVGREEEDKETEEMADKMTLYKIKDTETYGRQLAIGSDGMALFEERGSLTLHKVKPSDIEKVIPYSVGITFSEGANVYHYWSKEGDVEVGDLLFVSDSFATVVKVDTKSERADKWLVGHKFVTTKLEKE